MSIDKTNLPWDEDDFYDTSDYVVPNFKGVFTGELTYTMWGRRHNKIAFVDLADGRKIVVHAWRGNFFGLCEMAYGTEIEVTLKRNGKGRIYLADLVDLDEREWQAENGIPIV